jgi:hypothetical protein
MCMHVGPHGTRTVLHPHRASRTSMPQSWQLPRLQGDHLHRKVACMHHHMSSIALSGKRVSIVRAWEPRTISAQGNVETFGGCARHGVGGLDAGDRRLDLFRTRLPSVALHTQGASQRAPSECIWSQRHPPRSPSAGPEECLVPRSLPSSYQSGPFSSRTFLRRWIDRTDGAADDVEAAKPLTAWQNPPPSRVPARTSPDTPTDRYSLSCTSETINTRSGTGSAVGPIEHPSRWVP